MLTWAFQFEDREYFGGLRTLSTNGIDKPVLNVFRLLARLGGTRLALTSDRARDPMSYPGGDESHTPPDISGIAACNEAQHLQVFLSSHHDDWDVQTSSRVQLALAGLEPDETYAVYRTTIDHSQGNAHAAWVQMGRPQPPSEEEQHVLQRAARLRRERWADVTVDANGEAELSAVLPAHSVCLVELVPVG